MFSHPHIMIQTYKAHSLQDTTPRTVHPVLRDFLSHHCQSCKCGHRSASLEWLCWDSTFAQTSFRKRRKTTSSLRQILEDRRIVRRRESARSTLHRFTKQWTYEISRSFHRASYQEIRSWLHNHGICSPWAYWSCWRLCQQPASVLGLPDRLDQQKRHAYRTLGQRLATPGFHHKLVMTEGLCHLVKIHSSFWIRRGHILYAEYKLVLTLDTSQRDISFTKFYKQIRICVSMIPNGLNCRKLGLVSEIR